MNWSAEQQRLLGAMGYELLIRVTPGQLADSRATTAAAEAPNEGDAGSNAANFPELRRALRRAAGDRDITGLLDDIERLRREPALKRALWMKLKTLRRSQ
jgi:hypothetical protein